MTVEYLSTPINYGSFFILAHNLCHKCHSFAIFGPDFLPMFPDLSYFFHYLFGTPVDNWLSVIQTFGLFLTMAVVTSGFVLFLEFKRYEREGIFQGVNEEITVGRGPEVWPIFLNALIGFLLGFKLIFIIANYEEFVADAAAVVLSSKGNIIAGILGAILFGAWKWYEMKKEELLEPVIQHKLVLPHQLVPDITIIAAISGVIGARLFSILENMEDFIQDPIGQILSGSGLTIYGGLILAFIVVFYYVKKKGMRPIHVMDAVAPSLIIGYAVGRLGCQFSGDGDWGIVNELSKPSWFVLPDWAWAYDYPHNVINSLNTDPETGNTVYSGINIPDCNGILAVDGGTPEHCTKLKDPVYPTPIYEAFLAFLIFGILWFLRKRVKVVGMLFFIYLIFNGIERFFVEGIRVNEHYNVLGLNWSLSQFIAMGLFLLGVMGTLYLLKYGERRIE